jgi:hypothetical protein
MYGDPDIASVPDSLLPLVEASLAKDPQSRPTAQQLLDRLTSASSRPGNVNDTHTQVILARTWQSGSHASPPPASRPAAPDPALPRQPAAPDPWPHVAPPAAPSAAALAATETPTADQSAPALPLGAVPSAMAPAAATSAPRRYRSAAGWPLSPRRRWSPCVSAAPAARKSPSANPCSAPGRETTPAQWSQQADSPDYRFPARSPACIRASPHRSRT